jgi:hypothetical protein
MTNTADISSVQQCLQVAANALACLRFDGVLPHEIVAVRDDLARVRGRLQVAEATFSRHVATLNDRGEAPHPTDLGSNGGKVPDREARRQTRNADLLGRFPAMNAALGDGAISMAHVDALAVTYGKLDEGARVLLVADDADLAAQARRLTVVDFARLLRRRVEKEERGSGESPEMRHLRRNEAWIDTSPVTGRGTLRADLSPESIERVRRLLSAEAERIRNDPGLRSALHPDRVNDPSHVRSMALLNLLTREPGLLLAHGQAAPPPSAGASTDIVVIIDADTLLHGEHDDSVCEYGSGEPVSVGEVRRLACEAGLLPVVLAGRSQVLDLGRDQRLASRPQRLGLRALYRTCAHGDCGVPFDQCQIHHTDDWLSGGTTDLANLFPICQRHHTEAHTEGWSYHLDADRTLTIRRPDGTTTFTVFTPLTTLNASPPGCDPPSADTSVSDLPGSTPGNTHPSGNDPPDGQLTFVA